MPCNAPLDGWKAKYTTARGKRAVVFKFGEAYADMPVQVNCGKCLACRLSRAREWAIRCTNEASLWNENSYVTLTYRTKDLPMQDGVPTLCKRDWQLFMKKLRRQRDKDNTLLESHGHKALGPIRFFMAGEYGELGRPHYHALLFNCGFSDRKLFKLVNGLPLYTSKTLNREWGKGFSSIGEVTFESAGYVARYTVKKDMTPKRVGGISEFSLMSRNKGIGAGWIEKYMSDVYPWDEVVTGAGVKWKPPRYYDTQLEKVDEELLKHLKRQRLNEIDDDERRGSRAFVREEVLRRKGKQETERRAASGRQGQKGGVF